MNMKCETVIDRLISAEESQNEIEMRKLGAHLETCEACRDEWRGAVALRALRLRPVHEPREDLFAEVMLRTTQVPARAPGRSQFWAGTAFGGLLAAGIVFAVLTLGFFRTGPEAEFPTVLMALGEQQEVSIAIDAERDLPNTMVNVTLSNGFEIAGFGEQRTLSWTTDLEAGVNKLSLPISAISEVDGQLLVHLEHEGTKRTFRVELKVAG